MTENLIQVKPVGVYFVRALDGPKAVVFIADDDRLLPIYIGLAEAISIDIALRGEKLPRPCTHDLMAVVIDALGGTATKAEIDDLDEDVYLAKLYVRPAAGEETIIDARPSDCIALAVRRDIPLYVSKDIFARNATDRKDIEAAGPLEGFFE